MYIKYSTFLKLYKPQQIEYKDAEDFNIAPFSNSTSPNV